MSKDNLLTKPRDAGNGLASKPGNKLKDAMKATKKLNYTDLQLLSRYINETLEVKKKKQIDDLEQQLRELKGN